MSKQEKEKKTQEKDKTTTKPSIDIPKTDGNEEQAAQDLTQFVQNLLEQMVIFICSFCPYFAIKRYFTKNKIGKQTKLDSILDFSKCQILL
ncbi:hypothetical protein RFI_20075 [Reticulomyxa filosa]|uniref:Uncharacterized protein n=1 Tax=Reticulomyxa filosa TaxID=46433 RepID=X6MVX6_RETFI|nr:hypothetical protein RFI_20075 [Reticulomyxa filosa]|eukprot:ETO17255.1 hypothetical protein RFI_20075 [Reticulomyxa filosa]